MSPGRRDFEDDFEKSLRDAASLSDAELERLMGEGDEPPERSRSYEDLESGTRVEGSVVEVHGQELLVELDGKTLGIVDLAEYEDEEPPGPGARLQAEFVRHDPSRDVCILTTRTVRTDIAWAELRPGMVLEGTVTETNKGGLTLAIKGMRAFMPISQIECERVEDSSVYVGRKLRCEVMQVDRADRDLVVSRRALLEREREAERQRALEGIELGDVIRGRVTRLTEHGAFIDLGGVDGLLHASKMRRSLQGEEDALRVGDIVDVEVTHVDRGRGRVGLDFRALDENPWEVLIEGYAVGDTVTGWISAIDERGARLSIEEGLEARILPGECAGLDLSRGTLVRATVVSIDRPGREVIVRPVTS